MKYVFAGIPTKPFAILYIMHSFASFLQSDRDLHPNVCSILVILEVFWWRCRTYRAARRWIISSCSSITTTHKYLTSIRDITQWTRQLYLTVRRYIIHRKQEAHLKVSSSLEEAGPGKLAWPSCYQGQIYRSTKYNDICRNFVSRYGFYQKNKLKQQYMVSSLELNAITENKTGWHLSNITQNRYYTKQIPYWTASFSQ